MKARKDQKWTADRMYPLIEECLQRNGSQSAFCRQRGIRPSTFYYWVKKYKKEKEHSDFVAVEVTSGSYSSVEVIYPNGVMIRFGGAVPSGYLKNLLSQV